MTTKERDEEESVMLVLFLLSSIVYFSSTCGLFSSNAGSQYALLKSIAEKQTFRLNEYAVYTGFIDYSSYGGGVYSDRAPGFAFAAVPFYLAGKIASTVIPTAAYLRGWDPGNPAAFTSLLLSVLAGALSVVLVYRICRLLEGSVQASVTASLAFAFGTIIWKYSTTFFSHSFVTFIVLLALYLALTFKDISKHRLHACALFFTLGYLPLAEYPNALLTGIILLYLVLTKKISLKKTLSLDRAYIKPLACMAVPLLAIPLYNLVNFNNPLTTPYTYHHFEWVRDLRVSMNVPWSVGLVGTLITSPGIDGGLFVVSPVLMLSLWGLWYLYRSHRNETILMMSMFTVHVLLYSKYQTWFGGGVMDTRYITHVIPLMAVPLCAWVDGFMLKRKTTAGRVLYGALMWMLLAVSVLNVTEDVATFEGHSVRRFAFPVLQAEQLKLDMTTIFPNLARLPVFLGFLCILYAALSLSLKRTPGVNPKEKSRLPVGLTAMGLVVIGVLAVILFSGQPQPGVSLGGWRYSTDGFKWQSGSPPFMTTGPKMFVEGFIDVGGPGSSVVFAVAAQDCVKDIYLNGGHLGSISNCTTCLHCNGLKFDLTRYAEPGLNLIGFEIQGLGNATQFMVQQM